ncbi:porin family protein [Hymenobacter arizonensis]|uniref:Outer membrane protein beta-barrel domain-containing protein n=1 Tax=Hymenobacter arizonensis TaxID=1227077 RepID=A0A1I5YBS5_HYMAR|nr:porin family protein [Hymenobacter arizonensis]SFQ41580.1 Outer membrane protein beta-barrel domain-containing protein [Hymenobacter arizonensis]
MKKVILSLGLLVGVTAAAQAQNVTFGLKAGVNLANVTGDNTRELKSIIGANGGLAANFGFSDLLSVQPELLYSMKGTKYEVSNYKREGRLNYLDVPVLVKFNADGPFFELGPQVGFLVSQKTTEEVGGRTASTNSTDGTRKVDFGYVLGLGYQLASGPSLGLRYNGGFSDLSDPSVAGAVTRNSVFQFQLGYMFGGK